MKQIINNKVYNTSTATRCGVWSINLDSSLFFIQEALYKKKTNEFFLHCEGGAGSKYAEHLGEGSTGYGERIEPLAYESARKWAEEKLSPDEYESIFGAVDEDEEGKKLISLYLPEGLVNRLSREATEAGKTFTAHVRQKLEN